MHTLWKLCGLFHSAQDISILFSVELEIKHFISPQIYFIEAATP